MAERTAAGGIVVIGKETTKGTAVTPDLFTPYYSESLSTNLNMISVEPAHGNKFKRFKNHPGTRSHGGTLQVMAEPNTGASWFDMLSTKGTTTGADPYTHPFTASSTTDPNSYTIDIQWGHDVIRFIGCEASKVGLGWNDDLAVFDIDLSGLKSFYGREIDSIATQVITLKSDGQYDAPTDGLVAGDILQIYDVSAGTYISCTLSTIDNDTDITVTGTISAAAAGDVLTIRPQTVSTSLLTSFLHPKTQYYFSTTASQAFTDSSTPSNQTRLERGTTMEIMHDFEDNEGSKRSGSFDPASLPRIQYDATLSLKVFLDTPDRHRDWAEITKKALVMRAYSGASNEYEMRVTFNNLKAVTNETPADADAVVYHEEEYRPEYDETDGQAFDVKFINSRATI